MATLEALLSESRPLVMGVLNATPDSFSDGGKHLSDQDGPSYRDALLSEEPDILDIGGESTAPGSLPVDAAEEWRRIEPFLTHPSTHGARSIPISIDTYKAAVAEQALSIGAELINDVSALRADSDMARTVAAHNAFLLLMHSKEAGPLPHVTEAPRDYSDVVEEIAKFLLTQANDAMRCGVSESRILLDPGMGRFISHDPRYSWDLLRRFESLCRRLSPFPVCVATSRKSFLETPMSDRDPVSQLSALRAVDHGARIVRTHRPRMMKQFLTIREKLT